MFTDQPRWLRKSSLPLVSPFNVCLIPRLTNYQRFDQGPSLLLLPGMFEETFHDLGTSLADSGVRLHKCNPNYHIHFHDGVTFSLSTDLAAMKREIEAWEGKPGFDRYLSFLKEAHTHYEASAIHVLHRNFEGYLSMLRWGFLRNVFALHPFESIWGRASQYFMTERLRRVFTFGSMYMGMSPYEAPGTYSLLQYTELAEGIWYPEGGFNKVCIIVDVCFERRSCMECADSQQVPSTLADISRSLGADYKLSTSVQSITTDASDTHATGVILDNGTALTADAIIANADLVYAYNNLLPQSTYSRSLSARTASCSSLSFYWALDTTIPELKAHNIFLAEHYRESFDQIFHDQDLPDEPSFYVNVPSRVDPTASPQGKDAVVILCPVGHLLASESSTPTSFFTWGKKRGLQPKTAQDWENLVSRARESVLQIMETRLGTDIRSHIIHEDLNTPSTWETKFNLDKGAILGLSHSFFNVLCFRPATRHATLQNLHFVGASTHPGTGVPIVLAGAKLVADEVCEDFGARKPWGEWDAKAYERRGDVWAGGGEGKRGVKGAGMVMENGDEGKVMNGVAKGQGKGRDSKLDEVHQGVTWGHVFAALVAWLAAIWLKRSGYV